MGTSSFLVAALLGGFVLYLAQKNRLAVYTGVLWGAAPAPAAPASTSSSSSGSGIGGDISTAASIIGAFA